MTTLIGAITHVASQHGYGLIQTSDGREVVFHAPAVIGRVPFARLIAGQPVTFERQSRPEGRGAWTVRVRATTTRRRPRPRKRAA